MPRKKARDILSHLEAAERAQVLSALLDRHTELREEANDIARDMIEEVSDEAVAGEVADLVTGVGLEEMNSRAGRHSWGYVEPTEAAWELLTESIKDVLDDMKRRFEAGMKPAAEKTCQGIVLGLHRVEDRNSDGALGWAPDFPVQTAAWSISTLLELYPQRQKRTAGNRIVEAVEKHAEDWVEMLTRVVDRAASAKHRGRR